MFPLERAIIHEALESDCRSAAWKYARAAACPWWQPIRRALLVRAARAHLRLADADAKLLLDDEKRSIA
jgi:hypothetical protein